MTKTREERAGAYAVEFREVANAAEALQKAMPWIEKNNDPALTERARAVLVWLNARSLDTLSFATTWQE